ncbi:MAG: Holliday junction branch migration protein RuvA [Vallitaleaceae bacterium]|jgi:holliday junction DNA helicase RuvA|nr:Holliday junction branch migration protein RuvA [Vallitaleaceae bacterium]
MISYIKGILVSKKEEVIVVECGHIGYEIYVPLSVIKILPPINNEVVIYTELYVREDLIKLYGFTSREDLEIFKKLITVSGIGPKGALGILSTLTPEALRFAILTDNVDAISEAKGIGKKTASKLIIELKDKLPPLELSEFSETDEEQSNLKGPLEEAILALLTLGYTQNEAKNATKQVKNKDSVSTIIKEALQYLARE